MPQHSSSRPSQLGREGPGLRHIFDGQPQTTMPRRRAAAAPWCAVLFAIAATAQEARDFAFCGDFLCGLSPYCGAHSEWTNDFGRAPHGDFEFPAADPITGAGCRAITTTPSVNAIWLWADQDIETDYSVEVMGRPEITGEAGGWGVLLRAHGFRPRM